MMRQAFQWAILGSKRLVGVGLGLRPGVCWASMLSG
jgi:hypothetical protein